MNMLRKLAWLLALIFCGTLTSSFAADFNFSYLFGDGLRVSGSLTGTANGAFVDNVSNVTLRFNGALVPGAIFASKYDSSSPNSFVNGAVVSFDPLRNNFLFSNSNVANGDFSYDSFFNILNTSVFAFNTAVGQSLQLGAFGSQDLPTRVQSWTLALATTPPGVPEGGVTLALLGVTLVGMLGMRRKV